MKKFLPVVVILIIVVTAAVLVFKPQGGSSPATSKPTSEEPVNTIDLKDRPYVTLAPKVGGRHPVGQEIVLTLHANALNSTTVEYELDYQAGSLLQGAFGTVDLTKSQPPISKDLLFGSCSTGGKCAYHKDVTGGTLTLRFQGGDQNFALKGEWNIQNMGQREGKFSSRDAKFQLEIPKTGLPTSTLAVISQTLGLPAPANGEVIAGPYAIFTNNQKLSGTAKLTLRLNQNVTTAKLLGWAGKAWKEYPADTSNKTLTATIDSLTTFIAVSQ